MNKEGSVNCRNSVAQYPRQSGRKNFVTFNSYVATKAEKSIWKRIVEMSQQKLKAISRTLSQQINLYHNNKKVEYSK